MIRIIKESKNVKVNKNYKKEGTGNFYYKNRCVVVTDEDFENDNVPPLSDRPIDNSRNYPAYEVDIWKLYKDDLKFNIKITFRSGYYEGACIDYLEDEDANPVNYDSMRDIENWELDIDIPTYEEMLEKYENEHLKEYDDLDNFDYSEDDYENEMFDTAKKQAIKLYDSEIEKANKIIDKIKEDFGYDEYKVSARFSSGETWYSKI